MINIGELTRSLSVDFEAAGVLVTQLHDEPPRPPGTASSATTLGHKFGYPLPDVHARPLPRRPELYLG